MNPYPARIEELHQWLEARFGQKDRQATEVLLTALLDPKLTRRKRPWLIVETDYPSRDTSEAWFSLGGEAATHSLAVPRVMRTQQCEETLQRWLSTRTAPGSAAGATGVFVDAEWRRLPDRLPASQLWTHVGWRQMMTRTYAVLMAMCVRLRVEHPRSAYAALADRHEDLAELGRRARRVLDDSHRAIVSDAAVRLPDAFMYWCELLQRIAPLQTDWESLVGNLTAIATGVAALYADGRDPDWRAVERVMRDSIPFVTVEILKQTALKRSEGIQAYQRFRKYGYAPHRLANDEVKRLNVERIVAQRAGFRGPRDPYEYHPWRYRVASKDWLELIDREKKIL
jgi:hypothetical protein